MASVHAWMHKHILENCTQFFFVLEMQLALQKISSNFYSFMNFFNKPIVTIRTIHEDKCLECICGEVVASFPGACTYVYW